MSESATNIWDEINNAAADITEKVRQSLVQIRADRDGIGAGTIWHSDGLIITNAHVVLGRHVKRSLQIVLADDRAYNAHLLAYDTRLDIAALAIDANNLPTIIPGSSADLKPGNFVMALGHPWGIIDSLTAGIVIGTGDKLPEQVDGRDWIALDLKMRPGHSGGPLFNTRGQLVGINTMIQGPQVSFAVPVNIVKAFLKETLGSSQPQAAANTAPSSGDVVIV